MCLTPTGAGPAACRPDPSENDSRRWRQRAGQSALAAPPAASRPGTETAARTEADVFHSADNAAGCPDHAGRRPLRPGV